MAPLRDHSLDLVHLSAEIEGTSWAVLSFAPDDTVWCDWLYRNLNGYPVPVQLIEQVTRQGLSRPNCLSIFPDRADPDHASHYPRALETSGYLIVVCSPRSTHSPAVDMQIRAFKRAGGEERIIALVVEGEPDPFLENKARNPDLEWLPAWLRFRATPQGFAPGERSEPRIIDARPGVTSLRGVRDALLAALLEIDRNALGRLGGLQRPLGQAAPPRKQSVVASPSSIVLPPVPRVNLPALPTLPPMPPRRSKAPALIAAAAVVLLTAGGIAGWFAAQTGPGAASTPVAPLAKKPAVAPHAEPKLYALEVPKPPPVVRPSQEPSPQPFAPRLSVPDPLPEPTHPGTVTSVIPALPDDAALLNETREWTAKAADALTRRDHDAAIELYRSAIPSARLYLTRPGADTAGKAEIAELYRQLGTMQALHASTAEARASYREGRRILLSIRGGRDHWSDDCDRLYDEFETCLRNLERQ